MVLTPHDLHALMDRAIALCCPQTDDQTAFRAHLVGVVQQNNAILQYHSIDTHALGSTQMAQRGQITRYFFHAFATMLGENASLFARPGDVARGADRVHALGTGRSLRLPPGEDTFSLQRKQPGAMCRWTESL